MMMLIYWCILLKIDNLVLLIKSSKFIDRITISNWKWHWYHNLNLYMYFEQFTLKPTSQHRTKIESLPAATVKFRTHSMIKYTIDATYKFTTHQFNTTRNGTSLYRQKMLYPFYESDEQLFYPYEVLKPISTETHAETERKTLAIFFSSSSHFTMYYTRKNITFIYWISHQWTFLSLMHFHVILAIFCRCCCLFVWNPGEITFDEHMYTFVEYIK